MFEDCVVNLTYYFHPGGQFLLYNAVGQDIGQYMNGSLTNTKASKVHNHSSYAYSLLWSMIIARIDKNVSIMKNTNFQEEKSIDKSVD